MTAIGGVDETSHSRPLASSDEALRSARPHARTADRALDPEDMGATRYTRHSFARSLLRTAARERWSVTRERFDVDVDGRGDVVYCVDIAGSTFRFVAFSTTVDDSLRTDRVIAEAWDVTAALVEGELSPKGLAQLRENVPSQEGGRADAATLVWTRANRSQRFFDYVVDRLAAGNQPETEIIGDGAYVLRSTAFYANGKWGLADFDGIGVEHPLSIPYRAQMLAAWLLRELSYDLVEHCARLRSETAVRLDGGWRRYFGLGNATGLGMVPYIINHPVVLDSWVALRELALAHALSCNDQPESTIIDRTEVWLARAVEYFAERDTLASEPYCTGPELAADLEPLLDFVRDYQKRANEHPFEQANAADRGGNSGASSTSFARAIHEAASEISVDARQVVDSILVECHPEIDDAIERLLRCDEPMFTTLAQSCETLLDRLATEYAWVDAYNFDDGDRSRYFWFSSANNEEPRRGLRGVDLGEHVEHPLDVARAVQQLKVDLRRMPATATLAEFLVSHPWQRGAVERTQRLAGIRYGEVRANLLDADFLPLDLQRFQLAVYGMENYSPQSTDWLRVTLFSGAPRVEDVAAGIDDDWLFNLKPQEK